MAEQVSTDEGMVVETQASSVVTDTPEVVTPEVVVNEADPNTEDNATPETGEKTAESEVEKIKRQAQRRIDKRTADYYREQARANQEQQQREALARRVAELEAKQQEYGLPAEQQTQTQQAYSPQQIEAAVKAHAQYLTSMGKVTEKCNQVAETGAKMFPDFKEKMTTLTAETGPLFTQRGEPTATMQVILEADNPAALLHHLGSNPDVAAEIADLTPTQLARRLDRIERDIAERAKTKPSAAPKPLTPVKGAAGSNELSPDLPIEEWMRRREKQLKESRNA